MWYLDKITFFTLADVTDNITIFSMAVKQMMTDYIWKA